MRRLAWIALPFAVASAGLAAEPIDIKSLLAQMADLELLTRRPEPAFRTAQASSFDRSSKRRDAPEWFANGDAGHFLRVEQVNGANEWVMADLKGPGAVVRIWSANPAGTVRFYFDGEPRPRIECPLADLLSGKIAPFGEPFAYVAASGWNLYFPIPYAKSLKVTLSDEGRWIYYHLGYRTYTEPANVRSFKWSELDGLKFDIQRIGRLLLNPDARKLPDGLRRWPVKASVSKGFPFVFSIGGGPGAVYELRMKLDNPKASATAPWTGPRQWHNLLRNTLLRAAFDGEPCVEAPLGDFFGSAPGINPFRTFPMEMKEDGTMVCRFVMPFAKSCRLEVSTRGSEPVLLSGEIKTGAYDWTDRSYHFKAQWISDRLPTRPMRDMLFLNAAGEGLYVGNNLHVGNPVAGWWGEGDEKIYVDGEDFPSTFGTGSEDYYGYAWSQSALFSRPYHAQPRCDGPGSFGHTSVARYHLLDAIPFARSLRFDMELWHSAECTVDYDRTVYWYGKPGSSGPVPVDAARLALTWLKEPLGVPGAIEGEKLKYSSTGGSVSIQQGLGGASTSRHLWWTWMRVGDRLRVELPVKKAGVYELSANFTCAHDYGIHRASVNGAPLPGELDFYAPNLTWRTIALGTFKLKAGVNVVEFECVGKNPSAADGWMLGLDYFMLKRL